MAPPGMICLHGHLMPGVDDGARSLDDALEGVRALRRDGVRLAVATPHVDASVTRSAARRDARLAQLDAAWERLVAAAAAEVPEVTLHRGSEVMLDLPDPDLSDPRLRLAGGRWVLVEFPRLNVPSGIGDVLHRLRMEGLRPIVAHPERYLAGPHEGIERVRRWREMGAGMAVNAGSITGRYGSEARELAFRLLAEGWVDVVASDLHPRPGRSARLGAARTALEARGGATQAHLLTTVNPGRAVEDADELEPVPPLAVPAAWRRALDRVLGRG